MSTYGDVAFGNMMKCGICNSFVPILGWHPCNAPPIHQHCFCIQTNVMNGGGWHKRCCTCGEQRMIGLAGAAWPPK